MHRNHTQINDAYFHLNPFLKTCSSIKMLFSIFMEFFQVITDPNVRRVKRGAEEDPDSYHMPVSFLVLKNQNSQLIIIMHLIIQSIVNINQWHLMSFLTT